eukprot:snap_masked-scaffold_30-processed-gene-3.83-mRNA-1 protein AED:1.00 eAED:1.00 QI:0/0/0/0/1/1/2/0/216
MVWKIVTNIKGLRHALKVWHKILTAALKKLKMKQLLNEHCPFVNERRMKIIVLIYVDDLLHAGSADMVDLLEKFMETKFQLNFNFLAGNYVGLKFTASCKPCLLSAAHHVTKGFIRHKIEGLRSKFTIPYSNELNEDTSKKLFDEKQYQQIVGIINYVTMHGWLRVAYGDHVFSSHMSAPTANTLLEARFSAVKKENDLMIFVDSSFANGPWGFTV